MDNDTPASANKRGGQRPAPKIPAGLANMSNLEAALAYARCGIYVGPAKHMTKHPGSILGSGWDKSTTRRKPSVEQWFKAHPDAEVFLHVGKSGLVLFDLDVDDLAVVPEPYHSFLRTARIQHTRLTGDRGHYLFRANQGELFSNSPGGFAAFGEVRGKNGVIVAQPSNHVSGGRYRWTKSGPIPPLPDELRQLLKQAAEHKPAMPRAELHQFLDAHTGNDRPNLLRGVLEVFDRDIAGGKFRHGAAVDALCMAFRESVAGCYPARRAYEELEAAFERSFEAAPVGSPGVADRRRSPAPGEFAANAAWAATQALESDPAETLVRLDRDKTASSRPIFTRVSARELAAPIKPMEWLVRDMWALNSFGPLAGEKKTLKTYNLLAMAIAVASGNPMFGHFPVERPGPVVLYVAEGGREPFQRRAQRVADAYKVKLEDLPLTVVFGAAPLNGRAFLDNARDVIEDVQPVLFGLDPLYAYHPGGVDAGNVYDRGPMLQQLRADLGEELSLVVPDHFNKTASKGVLDLDMIAQAGWGPAADSWILQGHRDKPDLEVGLFRLAMVIGSRQWGGRRMTVDWSVPSPDEEGTAPEDRADLITWEVGALQDDAGPSAGAGGSAAVAKAARRVLEVLDDHPFALTKTAVVDAVGMNANTVRDAIDSLLGSRTIEVRRLAFPDKNGRPMTADRLGRRDADEIKLRPGRRRARSTSPGTDVRGTEVGDA